MKKLKGIPVSSGIVIGRVFVLDPHESLRVPRRRIGKAGVAAEVERFERARAEAIAAVDEVYQGAVEEMGVEAASVFQFHMSALSDKSIVEPIKAKIQTDLVSAEYATSKVFRSWIDRFKMQKDSTFRTKVNDLQDLAERLLSCLTGERLERVLDVQAGTIIAARDLTPTQTAAFDRTKIAGIATDLGGPTSHTAIIARALGLPAVVGIQTMTADAQDGDEIIIDGDRGNIVIRPKPETIERYQGYVEQRKVFDTTLQEIAAQPAVTRDGVKISLMGNIEFPEEATTVIQRGGDGVGLYRTEFLYLTRPKPPTEEDHFEAYKACVERLEGRPLVIRTLDLGADKYTQAQAAIPERNPFLGLRSIRYSLKHLDVFRTQLRAILRASALGDVRVMFPLISSPNELRRATMLLRDAMEDLQDRGLAYDPEIQIGMMVEVPSAALMADSYAQDAAFFSIGTNDLVQYTLAVDRTNERVADLYQPAHPAISKLIRDVVRAGRRREVPVSCCGESAGDPAYALLLLGLGLRTLSVTASRIPSLKRMVRSVTIGQCERIAKKAISFDSELEAATFVRERARRLVPEAFESRGGE